MDRNLPEKIEKLQAKATKGSRRIEFDLASLDPIEILNHFSTIQNPTEEQKEIISLSLQAGFFNMKGANIRNRELLDFCKSLYEFHSSKLYKKIGLTWEKACPLIFGITKQAAQPYEEIWGSIPYGLVEELVNQGAALGELRLLAMEIGREEGAEIKFLDEGGGKELVVKGQKYSLEQSAVEAARAAFEFAIDLKLELKKERQARKGYESDIEKKESEIAGLKETLEQKKKKIEVGEKSLGKIDRRAKGFQQETETEIGRMVVELVYLAGAINQATVVEADIPFLLRYLEMVDLECYQRVLDKLRPHLPEDKDAI